MKKNNQKKLTKLLLLIYLNLCWFSPHFSSNISDRPKHLLVHAAVVILSLLAITLFYYLCKNPKLRLYVFLSAAIGITVYNFRYAFNYISALSVIYIYKTAIIDCDNNSKVVDICYFLSPIINTIGLLVNLKQSINMQFTFFYAIYTCTILLFFFAFEMMSVKRTDCLFETSLKEQYLKIFTVSSMGVVCSLFSSNSALNNSITYYPWFFFICLLIYEGDKCLSESANVVISKLKKAKALN